MRGVFTLMVFLRLYHSMNAMLKKLIHGCGDTLYSAFQSVFLSTPQIQMYII